MNELQLENGEKIVLPTMNENYGKFSDEELQSLPVGELQPEDWTHLTDYYYFDYDEFVEDTGLNEEIVNQIVFLDLLGWTIKSESYLNNHMMGGSVGGMRLLLKGEP
ncbi:hypothetical protein N9N24_01225, partial [Candidatus Marinimicrobia bacterium]|nr:hypothetical protein [Candidatus Neomarinimicrobiota bacterium]